MTTKELKQDIEDRLNEQFAEDFLNKEDIVKTRLPNRYIKEEDWINHIKLTISLAKKEGRTDALKEELEFLESRDLTELVGIAETSDFIVKQRISQIKGELE